jgi:hypothetical protein
VWKIYLEAPKAKKERGLSRQEAQNAQVLATFYNWSVQIYFEIAIVTKEPMLCYLTRKKVIREWHHNAEYYKTMHIMFKL